MTLARASRIAALALILSALLPAPVTATHTYTYRNGPDSTEYVDLGVGRVADLWWANDFQVVPGGQTLTHVNVAFGRGWQIGTPAQILVYDDVNNDRLADDLTLLTQFNTTIQTVNTPEGPTLIDSFDIPDTEVDGVFFVAVLVRNAPAPARMRADNTDPGQNSWLAVNLDFPGTFNSANPNSAELGPLFVESFSSTPTVPQADFVIEAVAVPEPATITLFSLLAIVLSFRSRDSHLPAQTS